MASEHNHTNELISKIESLHPARIAEVEDFVDFLKQRDQDRKLVRWANETAEQHFARVWDHADDAAYDQL